MSEVIVGADLNAKHPSWGGDDIDSRGRTLAEYLTENPDFMVRPADRPTRPNGPAYTRDSRV